MFTGIITDIGTIQSIDGNGDVRLEIRTTFDTATMDIGASIACSGVCLTVVETGKDWFAVQASPETTNVTTASEWACGTRLNLERALRMGDELGGHIVTGHVDGVGTVSSIDVVADSWVISFAAPTTLAPFIAQKGSVTVDGVSLTVNDVNGSHFQVNVIPHTQAVTTLGTLVVGASVNLEIDVLARYVARLKDVTG